MLTEVSDKFVKIVWADDLQVHLARRAPDRPPASTEWGRMPCISARLLFKNPSLSSR